MLRSLEVEGWEEWLARLDKRLERPVSICGECRMAKGSKVFFIPCFFIPCFFMPPEKTIALPYVDGTFAWNNAWGASLIDSADTCRPIKNHTINLVEELPSAPSLAQRNGQTECHTRHFVRDDKELCWAVAGLR